MCTISLGEGHDGAIQRAFVEVGATEDSNVETTEQRDRKHFVHLIETIVWKSVILSTTDTVVAA